MIIQGTTLTGTVINDGLVTNGLQLYLDTRNPRSWSGNGTTWYDLSPNAKHATFYKDLGSGSGSSEGTIIDGNTIFNNGYGDLRFDGTSGSGLYQYAAGPNLGTGITQFTVNTWFWIRTMPTLSGTTYPCLLTTNYTGTPNTVNFAFVIGNPGNNTQDQKLYGGFFDTSSGSPAWHLATGYTFSATTWYHACMTYDGATLTIYINGTSNTTLSYASSTMTQTLGYRVGRRWDNYETIDGYIPVMMVYNRALNSSEVNQIFNYHRGRYGV